MRSSNQESILYLTLWTSSWAFFVRVLPQTCTRSLHRTSCRQPWTQSLGSCSMVDPTGGTLAAFQTQSKCLSDSSIPELRLHVIQRTLLLLKKAWSFIEGIRCFWSAFECRESVAILLLEFTGLEHTVCLGCRAAVCLKLLQSGLNECLLTPALYNERFYCPG